MNYRLLRRKHGKENICKVHTVYKIYSMFQKRPRFLFFWNNCQKPTNFNNFGPPYVSYVISAERGVRCDWSVVKKLEACIHAEGGYFEHLLWHCLPDIPVSTHHNRFSQSHRCQPTTGSFQSHQNLKEHNKPPVRWKSLAFHKLVCWHFRWGRQVGMLQFVFFWDNINNQRYVWIMLLKMTVLDFTK